MCEQGKDLQLNKYISPRWHDLRQVQKSDRINLDRSPHIERKTVFSSQNYSTFVPISLKG